MSGNESDDGFSDDGLEVTDLRLESAPASNPRRCARLAPGRQAWRWAPLVVSLGLLGALILSVLPAGGNFLRSLQRFGRASTPTVVTSFQISPRIIQTTIPTTILHTPPAPALALAPASCGSPAPALTHVGPPQWGAAIGHAPVWLAGMSGAYPTLRLGPQASAKAYGWDAPYTQFGWPAPIGLVLGNSFNEPVSLTGWNIATGETVNFGFVQAGVWGAPLWLSSSYTLDPASPTISAGGSDPTGVFWYGYAFVPRAGCYVIAASWQGGSWKAIVSAGR